MTMGLLEGLLSAIGDEDTDIGGNFSTLLTEVAHLGDTTLTVETTFGWATSGKLGVDGIVYSYTGTTPTSFTGISYLNDTATVVGVFKQHRVDSEVLDLNRDRNALDRVRRAMLVDTATGDDLSAVGRNLGVLRLPFVSDDDKFRAIIKALAYNPRGTLYGLDLALQGLVGAGNYEILEDLLNYPCKVFIRLKGDAATTTESAGKAYLADDRNRLASTTTTLSLPATPAPLQVEGVRWKDEAFETDTRAAKPSAQSIVEYDGDSGTQAWAFVGGTGGSEATDVVVNAAGYCIFTDAAAAALAAYERNLRIAPESQGEWGMVFAVDPSATINAVSTSGLQWCQYAADTARRIAWGVIGSGGGFKLGLIDTSTGSFLAPSTAFLGVLGTFYDVRVVKNAQADLELWVDGNLIQTVPYASFPVQTDRNARFGCLSGALAGMKVRLKSVYHHIVTLTDYWAARGAAGVVASLDTLDVGTAVFQTADVGKKLRIYNTTAVNGEGGINGGDYEVVSLVSAQQVHLTGLSGTGAKLASTHPTRITLPGNPEAFIYPDSLGHQITLSGSTLGNNGTYVIHKILDPGTLADMGSWANHQRDFSNVCEVVAASFVTESGLAWAEHPNFTAESGLAWEMGDAGQLSGSSLTLPQALPNIPTGFHKVLEVRYSTVLSAQVLESVDVRNSVINPSPLRYAHYPLYVTDPLGYVRSYLDAVVAAGVIPDYRLV